MGPKYSQNVFEFFIRAQSNKTYDIFFKLQIFECFALIVKWIRKKVSFKSYSCHKTGLCYLKSLKSNDIDPPPLLECKVLLLYKCISSLQSCSVSLFIVSPHLSAVMRSNAIYSANCQNSCINGQAHVSTIYWNIRQYCIH